MTFWRICCLCSLAALAGCSDAGLYALNGRGAGGPDRADFSGIACVPLAAGDAFPVKVLYSVQEGLSGVPRADVVTALNSIVSRFPLPYISFGLQTFHVVTTGYAVGPGGTAGSFGGAVDFGAAVTRYGQTTSGDGPTSIRSALQRAKAVLSGDMITGCRGAVARSRYLVVLLVSSADTSCANPAFNAGLDQTCTTIFNGDAGVIPRPLDECSVCELDRITREVKSLVELRGAGEITVIPMYVPADPANLDPVVLAQVAAVARAGGSQQQVVAVQNLTSAINGINYASLQQAQTLKHFIAFNRSAISSAGLVLVDTDGDGVDDLREATLATDPLKADTDGDGIMDGIELKMGMNPLVPDVITGCSTLGDVDADRLNDCEERVLGTDACVADSDGDQVPDLIEALSRSNPLDPEDLKDSDADGTTNMDELLAHTDGSSADNDFRSQRSYGYELSDAPPTPDGRPCYNFRADNITLVETMARPNPPFLPTPAGTNDIYLYLQVGRQNQVHGVGIGALNITQVRFTPPSTRSPSGTVSLQPQDFITGN